RLAPFVLTAGEDKIVHRPAFHVDQKVQLDLRIDVPAGILAPPHGPGDLSGQAKQRAVAGKDFLGYGPGQLRVYMVQMRHLLLKILNERPEMGGSKAGQGIGQGAFGDMLDLQVLFDRVNLGQLLQGAKRAGQGFEEAAQQENQHVLLAEADISVLGRYNLVEVVAQRVDMADNAGHIDGG